MREESDSSATTGLEAWLDRHPPLRRETLFTEGQTVDNWQLLALLGRGGSGEVWRARHLPTGQTTAVKFLHRNTPESRERFLRERVLMEMLQLPGTARFIAGGEVDNIPFLATEELTEYPFPSDDNGVADLLLALIPTLAALHRQGFIHRDIKPTNIMCRLDDKGHPTPVLIDLGLLKRLAPEASPLASTISVVEGHAIGVGTPGYAAPEQFLGGSLSPATDIHALAILANHCFHNEPPAAWVPIIRRATSSIPSQRYESVEGLARAIRQRHRVQNIARTFALAAGLLTAGCLAFGLTRLISLYDPHDHVFVSAAATEPGDGSQRHPFQTITDGIHAVNAFGTVTVGPGTYPEHLVVNTKPLHLEAPAGPEKTIVQGHWGASVITVSDSGTDSTITGFTFTGGSGFPGLATALADRRGYEFSGGGAYCKTAAKFNKCHFVGNGHREATNRVQRTIFGGGLAVMSAAVVLTDCVISNNFAEVLGAGLVVNGTNGDVRVVRGKITHNDLGSTSFQTSNRIGGILVMTDASASIKETILSQNAGLQFGSPLESEDTAVHLEHCSVEGGARPNGVTHFSTDTQSRQDYRP